MHNGLLKVENLKTYFYTEDGVVRAVDGVDFSVDRKQTVGIVGESGCGKSITSMSIMGLIPRPPGRIEGGRILFNNEDLLTYSESKMRRIRGNEISMIFQEPMTSLNPVYTIGDQIVEALILHRHYSPREAKGQAIEALEKVRVPRAEKVVDEYPHQLSGGMRQRAMIAMALACYPKLLIADEPTTALDVTIQAQILDLINDLKEDFNTGIILITHDLGVIAEMSDQVVVMYAGRVVEQADVYSIFDNPMHPYTMGLKNSIPDVKSKKPRLAVVRGTVPSPLNTPPGCAFHPRCDYVMDTCSKKVPALVEVENGHSVRCFLHTAREEVQ